MRKGLSLQFRVEQCLNAESIVKIEVKYLKQMLVFWVPTGIIASKHAIITSWRKKQQTDENFWYSTDPRQ